LYIDPNSIINVFHDAERRIVGGRVAESSWGHHQRQNRHDQEGAAGGGQVDCRGDRHEEEPLYRSQYIPTYSVYPKYDKKNCYYQEFWKVYLLNEIMIAKIKEYSDGNKILVKEVQELEDAEK